MTRRCSHCSNNGHNSRTCPARGGGVRLFGVRLAEGVAAMKKSASMGCLPSSSTSAAACAASSSPAAGAAASPSGDPLVDHHHSASAASGYASDDPARASCSSNCRSERKKGPPFSPLQVHIDPWSKDRPFLLSPNDLHPVNLFPFSIHLFCSKRWFLSSLCTWDRLFMSRFPCDLCWFSLSVA